MNEEQIRSSTWEDGTWKEENSHGCGAPSEGRTNGEGAKEAVAQKEIRLTPQQEARFWPKVDKSPRLDGCWIWTAGKFKNGYGSFRAGDKMLKAHRIAWTLAYGRITHDLCVCHRCDNPVCVNPAHLFLGSDADNARDRESKGRGNQTKGDRHGRAKLTTSKVIEIRAIYAAGLASHRRLASQFGVGKTLIEHIVRRKIWKHIIITPAK